MCGSILGGFCCRAQAKEARPEDGRRALLQDGVDHDLRGHPGGAAGESHLEMAMAEDTALAVLGGGGNLVGGVEVETGRQVVEDGVRNDILDHALRLTRANLG